MMLDLVVVKVIVTICYESILFLPYLSLSMPIFFAFFLILVDLKTLDNNLLARVFPVGELESLLA